MRNQLAVIGLVMSILIGALAITPAHCSALPLAGAVLDGPVYTEQKSEEVQDGQVQVQVLYQEGVASQWDEAERTYSGTFPTGIGASMKIYPNVLSQLPVIGVVAIEGELERELKFSYNKKNQRWETNTPKVMSLRRDETGRWCLTVPLASSIGTGIHCLRFYALTQGAKRNDHEVNLIVAKIKWVNKSNKTAMIDTYRFKTESWPVGHELPSLDYLTDLLSRAGNGGKGGVFASLIASDGGAGDAEAGSGSGGYDDSSLLVQIANLEARVASLEAFDLKVWEEVQKIGRNSGKTEVEIQRLRQLVANHQLTLVQVIEYLRTPASTTADSTPSQTVPSQREVVRGNYSFQTSKRIWIKLYDQNCPQGRVYGPYGAGSIAINNADLGYRVDGVFTSFEQKMSFSANGQVWSAPIGYQATAGGVVVIPLGGGR